MEQCKPPKPKLLLRNNDEEEDEEIEDEEERKNPYTKQRILFERLRAIGKLSKKYCDNSLKEDAKREQLFSQGAEEFPATFMETNDRAKRCVQILLSEWTEYYVEHMAAMREILNLKFADGRTYNTTTGGHVFYEISRMHWLRDRPRAALEWENTHLIDEEDLVPADYDMLFSLEHTKSNVWIALLTSLQEQQPSEKDETEHAVASRELKARLLAMWKKPISEYALSETRALAMFLTQYLNDVRETQMEEFGRVFRILWIRCTQLMVCQYEEKEWPFTLDEEEFRGVLPAAAAPAPVVAAEALANRRYAVFCSFYLGEITRRFFHHEELSLNRLTPDLLPNADLLSRMRARMINWIYHVVDSFAEEAFEEMYMSIVTADEGGYAYPGDDGWFRYAFPQRVPSRGACVTTLRPHMYKRFYSETQVTRRLIVNQCENSHLARLFVLRAVDEHIKLTHARVEWLTGVVIDNSGMEMSVYALKGGLAPLLVQVFSSYWVYYRGQVYPTDDLFTTLALWWWLLREQFDSKLYNIDMSDFMTNTLEPPPLREDEEHGLVMAMESNLAHFEL